MAEKKPPMEEAQRHATELRRICVALLAEDPSNDQMFNTLQQARACCMMLDQIAAQRQQQGG